MRKEQRFGVLGPVRKALSFAIRIFYKGVLELMVPTRRRNGDSRRESNKECSATRKF